ncbi:ABC transporter substrate-binding protein [Lachnoclostridium sp. An196]|uniref:basic amino acid ABC transporter substrate-binding protein n=1 Tax=Lachnoclostridium sp. An196 TaxID=1965583 RepID=UPI000B36A4AE|nr:basic amino acid ABC transporter substrate-binding protein [Lachnoclostridium sp. An196]OUP18409.1 ABC transporter substrate-binding protein [Lachnoclostridium sp. An196]
MKKKVVSVMLCAAMTAAVLAGCGSSSAETVSEDTSAAAEETEDVAAEETAETAEADTEESAGGTLVMGTNAEFPPYEYYEGQEVVGIDAEMAAAVAEKLGMELKIEDMAFDSLIPALSSGKVDIVAAGMTVTEDRLASVNFSDTYATGIQAIIVTEDSDIASADDLVGKTIGVQQGTTGDLYATDVEGATIERYAKGMEAVQSLSQGKIDAVIIDNEPANVFVSEVEGLKILDEAFATEDYAVAVAKDNEELLEQVNTALAELKEDGTLQAIVDKYITAE